MELIFLHLDEYQPGYFRLIRKNKRMHLGRLLKSPQGGYFLPKEKVVELVKKNRIPLEEFFRVRGLHIVTTRASTELEEDMQDLLYQMEANRWRVSFIKAAHQAPKELWIALVASVEESLQAKSTLDQRLAKMMKHVVRTLQWARYASDEDKLSSLKKAKRALAAFNKLLVKHQVAFSPFFKLNTSSQKPSTYLQVDVPNLPLSKVGLGMALYHFLTWLQLGAQEPTLGVCPHCDKLYLKGNRKQRFCSSKCYRAAKRKKHKPDKKR